MDKRVIPLQSYINKLKRDIDDLEWDGQFKKADFLKVLLKDAEKQERNGEVYHPTF